MITFRDLLKGPYRDITYALDSLYQKHKEEHILPNSFNRDNIEWIYTSVIQDLLEPEISDSFNTIKISKVPEDEFNDKEYIDISILPEKGSPQSLEFVKWSEVVDSNIVEEGCSLSSGDKIFYILWELTLYGFDEDYISQCKLSHEKILNRFLKEKYGK